MGGAAQEVVCVLGADPAGPHARLLPRAFEEGEGAASITGTTLDHVVQDTGRVAPRC